MPSSEFPDEESLNPEQLDLIRQLREEVLSLKAHIAHYTLQAIAFATVVLVAIMGAQLVVPGAQRIGWLSLPLLLLMRAVSRTVVHKLGTINRNLGYELHLQRSRRLREEPFGWHHRYRLIGWEEAMRAWRIIQATIFARLCRETTWLRGLGTYRPRYRPETVHKNGKYCWYHVPTLVDEAAAVYEGTPTAETSYAEGPVRGVSRLFAWWTSPTNAPIARYHPGNYVAKMLSLVHWMMLVCLAPQAWALIAFARQPALELYATIALLAVSGAAIALWWARDVVRLDQLERGVLSIHSCAVVWQAVVTAHYRALLARGRARYDSSAPITASNGYTFQVARQAAFLAERVLDIQRWCDGMRDERKERMVEVELAELDGTPLGPATILNASISGRGVALAGITGHDSRALIGKRLRLRFFTGDEDVVVAAVVKVLYRSSKSGQLDHFGCTVAPESRDTLRNLLKLAS
jgi:hypothetical protein